MGSKESASADERSGARVEKPRWSRILVIVPDSRMAAMFFIIAPQCRQCKYRYQTAMQIAHCPSQKRFESCDEQPMTYDRESVGDARSLGSRHGGKPRRETWWHTFPFWTRIKQGIVNATVVIESNHFFKYWNNTMLHIGRSQHNVSEQWCFVAPSIIGILSYLKPSQIAWQWLTGLLFFPVGTCTLIPKASWTAYSTGRELWDIYQPRPVLWKLSSVNNTCWSLIVWQAANPACFACEKTGISSLFSYSHGSIAINLVNIPAFKIPLSLFLTSLWASY